MICNIKADTACCNIVVYLRLTDMVHRFFSNVSYSLQDYSDNSLSIYLYLMSVPKKYPQAMVMSPFIPVPSLAQVLFS